MKVHASVYRPAREDCVTENYSRRYVDREGLRLCETRSFQTKSDFIDMTQRRFSEDNGRTWSEWETVDRVTDDSRNQGVHQLTHIGGPSVWNPVHRHTVSFSGNRVWEGGREAAYSRYWSGENGAMPIHAFITVKDETGGGYTELVKYQDGGDFDPDNWLEPSFFTRNVCHVIGSVIVEEDGDILFSAEIPMRCCCEMRGLDINELYPTAPNYPSGIIVMRGRWNGERYELSCGRPVVISDRQSTRGFHEPAMTKLDSGRILLIMRASNAKMRWSDETYDPGMPGVKWYAYSDNGGKTFTDAMPWHFDDGEIIYSSATCSQIIRDFRTGRHFWIGNITSHEVKGNYPRYPLCIVELDEKTGAAKKASYTVIDTRREGEPETLQLSNFNLLQNRESGNLEILLSKFEQYLDRAIPNSRFKAEVWKYEIEL